MTVPNRLAYIDWMRGLACVLMFQTHCYDSWLGGAAREGEFIKTSQLLGTFPAPLFLFLAGVSFALVTDKLRQKGVAPDAVMRKTLLRGAQIFGLGILFRVWNFALGWPWAPWSDLLRVDVLNIIGISMMLMALLCRAAWGSAQTGMSAPQHTWRMAGAAAGAALLIAMLTPPLWTTWRVATSKLPWWLESYINGVHTFNEPQAWLFPIFPWTAFAFGGLAVGFVLFSDWAREREERAVALVGAAGVGVALSAKWLDALPVQIYAVYDFWHTSPNFFLIRFGLLLVILLLVYAWCRWGWGARGFSPIIQLGTTSLLVYWVHIELVYGRFSLLDKRAEDAQTASLGLLAIFLLMMALSLAKTYAANRMRKDNRR